MLMLGSFLSWWYGEGWLSQVREVRERLLRVNDRYSISLLVMTLFSPFRQISAGNVRGPLGVQLRAWIDRLVSRFIGAGVRSALILIGFGAAILELVLGTLRLTVWPLLPALPLLGLIGAIIGKVPGW
jgi:hypothetical protein